MYDSNSVAVAPSNGRFSEWCISGEGITVRVDSERFVLMQFTGLKDKKRTKEYPEGQEIYEGAIVKVNSFPQPMEVCFKEGQFGWGRKLPECHTFAGFIKEDKIEVLGSVYENPELLK